MLTSVTRPLKYIAVDSEIIIPSACNPSYELEDTLSNVILNVTLDGIDEMIESSLYAFDETYGTTSTKTFQIYLCTQTNG